MSYGSSKISSSESELSSGMRSSSGSSSGIFGESSEESFIFGGSSSVGSSDGSSSQPSSSGIDFLYEVTAIGEIDYEGGLWTPVAVFRGNSDANATVENHFDFAGGLTCQWVSTPGVHYSSIRGEFIDDRGFSFEWDDAVAHQLRRVAQIIITNQGSVDIDVDGTIVVPGGVYILLDESESYPFSHIARGFNVVRA